jgi:DNA-binding transcriptional ArsR family regulator
MSKRAEAAAVVFAALGDRTRLRLVSRLSKEGPLSIARLSEGEEVTRQAITKHLRVLEGARLVRATEQGRERIYEMDPKALDVARRFLDHVSARWDDAIERLRAQVEDDESS